METQRLVARSSRLLLCFAGILLGTPIVQAEISVTDDAERVVRLRAPAQRIVSLAPHATELLFAAGAGARLVGVSELSTYPEAARQLPLVSSGVRMDIERVLALRPDLVVGWLSGNARADLDKLVSFGIPVFIAEPRRLDAVPETLLKLGRLSGHESDARQAADDFRSGLDRLRADYRDRKPVWVFLQIAVQPLMTLNHAHLANDVLGLCGGRNIFAASELIAPDVGFEAVLLENPDAVLFSDNLGTLPELRKWWRSRVDLPAVRRDRLYAFPGELVLRQTPRVLLGARQLCESLDAARASLAQERKKK